MKVKIIIFHLLLVSQFAYCQDSLYLDWSKSVESNFQLKQMAENVASYSVLSTNNGSFLATGSQDPFTKGPIVTHFDCKGDTIWMKSYGFEGEEDFMFGVAKMNDNRYSIVGYTSKNEIFSDPIDGIIYDIDTLGNTLGYNTYGGSKYDVLYATVAHNNQIYSCGASQSSDNDLKENKGSNDIWVIKTDSEGRMLWSTAIGGSKAENAFSIALTTDNHIVIAGNTLSDDGDISGAIGNSDGIVAKLDLDGNLVWTKVLGGLGYDAFAKVIPTSDGNIIVTGYTIPDNGRSDILTVKLDPDGNILWRKTYGGSDWEVSQDIIEHNNGYLIAGSTKSTDISDIDIKGDFDFLFLKYDIDGELKWANTYGGTEDDRSVGFAKMNDESIVTYGYTESIDGDVNANSEEELRRYWLLKLANEPRFIPKISSVEVDSIGLSLEWTASDKIENYLLEITSEDEDFQLINSNEPFQEVNNLIPSTYYTARVGYHGYCDYLYQSKDSVVLTLPVAPNSIQDSLDINGDFKVYWNKSRNIDFYEIEIAHDPEFEELLEPYNPLVTSNTIITVENTGNIFYYRIRAKNKSGYSNYSSTKTLVGSTDLSIKVIGESCFNKNNGQITITAPNTYDYVANLGDMSYDFNSNLNIDNLNAGNYTLCIRLAAEPDFEQCYNLRVEAAQEISGKSKTSKVNSKYLENIEIVSGSAPYTVSVNGNQVLKTMSSSFSVDVKVGDFISVSSKFPCEGLFKKQIHPETPSLLYPNPTKEWVNIFVPEENGKDVFVEIYNSNNQLLKKEVFVVRDNSILVSLLGRPNGIYFLKIETENPILFKVIKQ